MQKIFITGISTEVGKTLISSVVVEALKADYWKPIQAGDLEYSDTHKVKERVSNKVSQFFPNAYALHTPMSPHAAAEIDNIVIDIDKIRIPKTENTLVIEGAGGLLVPLNSQDTILDIIPNDAKVIVVSRHYLGSINHTLMTVELLKQKGFEVGIVFSGDEHPTTESIILNKTGVEFIGRVSELKNTDAKVIKEVSNVLRDGLIQFIKKF